MTIGWVRWDAREGPRFGLGGIAAALGASGVAAAAWARLVLDPAPLSVIELAVLSGAGATMLVTLCRVEMPGRPRAGLALLLMVTMLTAAARADPFGMRAVKAAASAQSADSDILAAASDEKGMQAASDGARVALTSAPSGDEGWAARLNGRLDRRIGGASASAYRVTGEVSAAAGRVRLAWRIGRGDETVSCGVTSGGGNGALLADQFAEPLRQAVDRSVALGRVACP
ncbi:MAG TPA: hypothetical protein VFL92_12930 [Sphingomonas sp.]|nr:hypothetical protein [Sphingomonas sp.]